MFEINNAQIFQESWSLRDVSKIIGRLQYQKKQSNSYENFGLQHNLLFYALSRYEDKKKYLDKFCQVLKQENTLKLYVKEIDDLKETFNSETEFIEDKDILFKKKI